MSEGGRLWGVAVQLYTLRSASNWGIGDFSDLQTVVRHCAAKGAAFIGLNPLHALFTANPAHFSPYSPSSRHFLNILYIAVGDVPEFAECAPARKASPSRLPAELERLRATAGVDYPGVAAAKIAVLRELYQHFRREHLARDTARAAAFHAYVAERGEPLRLHAAHDAIDETCAAAIATATGAGRCGPTNCAIPPTRACAEFAIAEGDRSSSTRGCSGWRTISWVACRPRA